MTATHGQTDPPASVSTASAWTCWRDPSHPTRTHPVLGWPECSTCGAKPEYHARFALLPEHLILPVYVFAPSTRERVSIARSSGIVSLEPAPQDERVTIYYEGWVHGAAQYAQCDLRGRWEAGVDHAAGRLVTDYPTSAMASLPITALHVVGSYEPVTRRLTVTDEAALTHWLNPDAST